MYESMKGKVVFPYGRPQKLGRVKAVRIDPEDYLNSEFVVLWKSKGESTVPCCLCTPLETLINDHKKKIETHYKNIDLFEKWEKSIK